MTDQAESTSTENRRLCVNCVGEAFLRAKIEEYGQNTGCSYCSEEGQTFSIGQMADEVEIALQEHFYRTQAEPSYAEYVIGEECGIDLERAGEPVADLISWKAGIEPDPAEDIRKVLANRNYDYESEQMGEEGPFVEDAHYDGKGVDDGESQAGWLHFEESLRKQARYFNRTAEDTLRSTFEKIAEHGTDDGRPVIVQAGPGTSLTGVYRARVFQSNERLEEALERPDKGIGPPPATVAANGRMVTTS